MTQYNTIEDAILAIIQKYGVEIIDHTPRFIAILSDYAPNHAAEQTLVRAFARVSGIALMMDCIKQKDSYSKLLVTICGKAVQATEDMEQRYAIVSKAKALAAAFDSRYEKCDDPGSVYAEGMNYFRTFPKEKNIPIAVLLLEEAWSLGCTDALLYLSSTYLKGKGVQKNAEKGMHYLTLAAEAGSLRASIDYAEHLWKGTDTDKDIPHAVDLMIAMLFLCWVRYSEKTQNTKKHLNTI